MFQHVVVPIDGSTLAFQAVPVAARMTAAVDGTLEVVTVVDRLADVALARDALARGIEELGMLEPTPNQRVLAGDGVAETLVQHVESRPGSMLVMSSHGHARSAAVLGSTADEILRAMFGPIVLVGPHVSDAAGRLDGTYCVPLDGSDRSEAVLPIVAAWAVEFGGTPWLVDVSEPGLVRVGASDVSESGYVNLRAGDLAKTTHREVEFEALHGDHPARSIVDFADSHDVSLVFMTTHGRTGMGRLRLGSVAAEVVRHAGCPVVVFRPPKLLQ